MSTPYVFKDVSYAGCGTCEAAWFGRDADDQARQHAVTTGHLVTIVVTTRETHNASERDFSRYVEPAQEPIKRAGVRQPYAGAVPTQDQQQRKQFHGETGNG